MTSSPVGHTSIKDVPLEALPSEISSTLREAAASPGTGSGHSEVVSEPQSTGESTAIVNPEAPAISPDHGRLYSVGMVLGTTRLKLLLIIIGTCIALAGLTLQIRANRLSKEANELTLKGNAVAEESYKLQLWEDCRDSQDLQNPNPCHDASSLARTDVVVRKPQRNYGELNKMVLQSVYMAYQTCSSTFNGNFRTSFQGSDLLLKIKSIPGSMDLWHWVVSGLLEIFERLVYHYVILLLLLVLLPEGYFLLNGAKRHKKRSAMHGLWFFAFAIPKSLIAGLSSLSTGFDSEKAYAFVLLILVGLCGGLLGRFSYYVKIRLLFRTTVQDDEAQGHRREEPNFRTSPAIGRGISHAYVQTLKRRLGTYLY